MTETKHRIWLVSYEGHGVIMFECDPCYKQSVLAGGTLISSARPIESEDLVCDHCRRKEENKIGVM